MAETFHQIPFIIKLGVTLNGLTKAGPSWWCIVAAALPFSESDEVATLTYSLGFDQPDYFGGNRRAQYPRLNIGPFTSTAGSTPDDSTAPAA